MRMLKTLSFVCLMICAVFLNCDRSAKNMSPSANSPANPAADGELNLPDLYLNAKNRSASQAVSRDLRSPQNYAFVEVEVAKVVNPKKHAIQFEVYYDEGGDESVLLGTFSLFPADNPGTFLVPTGGKLKSGGKLIISLVLPEDMNKNDELEISVRPLRLKEK